MRRRAAGRSHCVLSRGGVKLTRSGLRLRSWMVACTAALHIALTSPASADDQDVAADTLFDKGVAHYNLGEYQKAIEAFREAYRLVREPLFLFNLGQAHRKAGNCMEALDMYQAFLREATGPENRDKAEQFASDLKPCAEEQRRAGALAEAAERAKQDAQRNSPSAQPSLSAGAQPRRERHDNGQWLRWSGLTAGVVGGAAAALGGYYWRQSAEQNTWADGCLADPGLCDWSLAETRARDAQGQSANRRAWGFSLGGAALVVGGAGLYLLGRSKVEWTLVPNVEGATLAVRGRM